MKTSHSFWISFWVTIQSVIFRSRQSTISLALYPCLLGYSIVTLSCIRKQGKSSRNWPCHMISEDSARFPSSLPAQTSSHKEWAASDDGRKLNPLLAEMGRFRLCFRECIHEYIRAHQLQYHMLFFFVFPWKGSVSEMLGLSRSISHFTSYLWGTWWRGGRMCLGTLPLPGASPSPSWAFHSSPHQVLILLSFFKYFPLGVCDNNLKHSASQRC